MAPQLPPQPQQLPVERAPRQPWNVDAIRALSANEMSEVLDSILSVMDKDADIADCFVHEGIDGETFLDAIEDPRVILDCPRH